MDCILTQSMVPLWKHNHDCTMRIKVHLTAADLTVDAELPFEGIASLLVPKPHMRRRITSFAGGGIGGTIPVMVK